MSIATTISSVVHAVLVLVQPGVWEAIFGRVTLSPAHPTYPTAPPTYHVILSSGGVEAAVSITVCNTTVIIPAVLRVLGVGDPFMREDTVDPKFSTGFDIAPMTLTRAEFTLPTSSSTRTIDSTRSERENGTVVSQQQSSVDSEAGNDQKYLSMTWQTSGGSLGNFKLMSVVLPVDEADITDSSCSPSPVVEKVRDLEAGTGRWHTKSDST